MLSSTLLVVVPPSVRNELPVSIGSDPDSCNSFDGLWKVWRPPLLGARPCSLVLGRPPPRSWVEGLSPRAADMSLTAWPNRIINLSFLIGVGATPT